MDAPAKPSATVQQARSKLEAAIERLEQVLDARAVSGEASPAPALEHGEFEHKLSEAQAEIGRLQEKNQTVSSRLDAAIDKMRVLLEE